MTTKLNLNPLIKYFSRSNPRIANRLRKAADTAEIPEATEQAVSDFPDTDLVEQVENVTTEDVLPTKVMIAKHIQAAELPKEAKAKLLSRLASRRSPEEVQFFFYNYVYTQDRDIVKAKAHSLAKVAHVLIKIADELDVLDPDLAQEADSILQEVVKSANMGMPLAGPLQALEADPAIQDPFEEEPEYDEIDLDELDGRLQGMNWRLTDRPLKERYTNALEHGRKAREYLDTYKKYRDKAHGVFDEGGDRLRFKFDID